MKLLLLLCLCVSSGFAHAVDGAGLQLIDVGAMLLLVIAPALPFLVLLAFGVLVVMRLRKKEEEPSIPGSALPKISPSELSHEDVETMKKWNIRVSGTQFQVGERLHERLVDAVAAAEQSNSGRDVP